MKEMIKAELNKGITQRDLAMRIGFSHSTIQKILFTDTKCTYETRKKVADYFRVPVSHFYDASVEAVPSPAPATDAEYWKNKYISCMEELNEAHKKIDRLTASHTTAERLAASSGKGAT